MPAIDEVLQSVIRAVIEGDAEAARDRVERALQAGLDPGGILRDGLTAAMATVGERLDAGEIFIPDVLWSADAMREGLALLTPLLSDGSSHSSGKVVLGTVQGDMHDIGKNLVGIMLSAAGFEVFDLGADVEPQTFVQAAEEFGAQLVGMSAMLTTTMPAMAKTLELLESRGLRPSIRVLVGGAPVTQAYADLAGADGWAIDAPKAVIRAKELAAQAGRSGNP